MIVNEKTWEYIRQHTDDDVRKLALKGVKDEAVDLPMALQQIAGRQTARRKLPSWAAVDGIVYPPHLNMEQCSSEPTARYKAEKVLAVACRVSDDGCMVNGQNQTFVDLTGGFGVDFYWMAKTIIQHSSSNTHHLVYVERDAELCAIVEHNFRLLGLDAVVRCDDGMAYLREMEPADVIFLDPARRNEHGGRTYGIADCTPNVLELLPLLKEKAHSIVLKLSPMLDWRKAVADLDGVAEVHIVSVDGECKELVIQMRNEKCGMRNVNEEMRNDADACVLSVADHIHVVCVNLNKDGDQHFAFDVLPDAQPISHFPFDISHSSFLISHLQATPISHLDSSISCFLYEPNASIMKAGCYAELEASYGVQQVAYNSHLFLSDRFLDDFPGRKFQIFAISSANVKDLKKKFSESLALSFTSMESANIAVRNFPMTADQLRKKLKLKDGGDMYVFATTLADGQHRLFICRKIG